MSQFGLRVKLYTVICEKHILPWGNYHHIIGIPGELFAVQTGNTRVICEALKKTTLTGYASLVVVINSICEERNKILRNVLEAININSNLRYKSKLILTAYKCDRPIAKKHIQCGIRKFWRKTKIPYTNTDSIHPVQEFFSKAIQFLNEQMSSSTQGNGREKRKFIKIMKNNNSNLRADVKYFYQMKLDNAMFKQTLTSGETGLSLDVWITVRSLFHSHLEPIQSLLTSVQSLNNFYYDFHTSNKTDLYLFNINPAMTIIINNYHFTNPLVTRQGSEQDVKRLIREHKIAGIPFLVIQDCDRNKVLQLMNCMKHLDCSSLRSLLIVIMSHGDRDDVINTRDGDVVIKTDIVESLQSNSSLKDVDIAIVVSACRGDIDPQYAIYNDLKSIQPTDSCNLASNVAIIYSTPKNVQSYRCPRHGSPFVISLCKRIRVDSEWEKIVPKIDEDLKEDTCYKSLKNSEITELVTPDPQRLHHINRQPEESLKMMQFFETLVKDLALWDEFTHGAEIGGPRKTPLFFMGGNLSSSHGSEIQSAYLYSDPKLDADHCSLDNDAALERCRNECVYMGNGQ